MVCVADPVSAERLIAAGWSEKARDMELRSIWMVAAAIMEILWIIRTRTPEQITADIIRFPLKSHNDARTKDIHSRSITPTYHNIQIQASRRRLPPYLLAGPLSILLPLVSSSSLTITTSCISSSTSSTFNSKAVSAMSKSWIGHSRPTVVLTTFGSLHLAEGLKREQGM